jgi:rhamnulokinase
MSKREFGAIAVDLGATSGRFAAGWLEDGQIRFEVIRQIPHEPIKRNGRLEWDLDKLLQLVREGCDYGATEFEECTLGIDGWGVDHGFVDADGYLLGNPICYRDPSHEVAFKKLAPFQEELYSLTGVQHQPFNTICQLVARSYEDPLLSARAQFVILPDLLGYLLTGKLNYELTQASTTQLLGLDGQWSKRAFEIAQWPVPDLRPTQSGLLGEQVVLGVRLVHVGSHDTASALAGFGIQSEDSMYVNVGTWSLAMFRRNHPIATREAEAANFTNERTVDGKIRFLKNIPGFYVLNRLHSELGVQESMADWLSSGESTGDVLDLFKPEFFNPTSMVAACAAQLGRNPKSDAEWAGIGLDSIAQAIAVQPRAAEALGVAPVSQIRIGGGGSQSDRLCQSVADKSGLKVLAGPVEATVLGNLATQLLASGQIESKQEMEIIVQRSAQAKEYLPA